MAPYTTFDNISYREQYKKELTENYGKKRSFGTINKYLNAVNNLSQVIGSIQFNITRRGMYNHGFMWEKGVTRDLGREVYPSDINDYGQVVGRESDNAFLLEQDGSKLVIQQNGRAIAINNHGDVVGDMRPEPH